MPELEGWIEAVQGSVVDVRFGSGQAPALREALRVCLPRERLLEVQAQREPGLVRALVLEGGAGLSRGMRVEALGRGLTIPVGSQRQIRRNQITDELLEIVGGHRVQVATR